MNSQLPATQSGSKSSGPASGAATSVSLRTYADVLGLVLKLNRLARRCALNPRIVASVPRSLDVLTSPMSQVADKAQRFASAVAKERADFESHYLDNRKRVVAYAWEVAHIVNGDDDRIAYEFACACLRAHRKRTGHDILERLASSEDASKHVIAAKRRFARVAWKAGDAETAVTALRSIRGRAARTQYRTWLGISTVRNGLLLAESGDAESAREVLIGGSLACGLERSMAQRVAAIYLNGAQKSAVDTLSSSNPVDELAPGSPDPPIPIVLAGFGWSGSGAVADFLNGHPAVADVLSGREMGLWTGKYGLDRLYAHFSSRGFNRRLLLEFLTRHCFGHKFLGHSKGTKSLGGMWAWLDDTQRWSLLDALASWLDEVRKWQKEPSRPLLAAFQALSTKFLSFLTPPETACVVLSNCIPSDAIAGIRMFDKPVVIVSWRNPADAYASKVAAFPDSALQFDGWKDQLMTRINRYLAGKAEVAELASLWIDVSFEEFVQSVKLRQELLDRLNLDGEELKSTFDPAVSARNIGILESATGSARSAWDDLANAVDSARREARVISERAAGKNSDSSRTQ